MMKRVRDNFVKVEILKGLEVKPCPSYYFLLPSSPPPSPSKSHL
jgi:hypothetical protein